MRFQKGHTPWNKGTIGLMKNNSGCFTKDTVKRSDYKTPHKQRDGFIITLKDEFCKTKDSRSGKIYTHHKRTSYSRFVMQQNGIQIPKGMVVYHIDGNRYNDDISNLEVITRAELAKRNRKQKDVKC